MSEREPITEHPAYSLAARNIELRREIDRLRAELEQARAEIRQLVHDDPVNGYGGWTAHDRMRPMSGDYSQWPAIAKALKP